MTDKKYISKLTYDQIRIWTNLCHEIRIRQMRIFLSSVTTLMSVQDVSFYLT